LDNEMIDRPLTAQEEAFRETLRLWANDQHGIVTPRSFVLQNGFFYNPRPRPKGMKLGPPKECFKNAQKLADPPMIYCEGYALAPTTPTPIHHGWLTNSDGVAFDPTWQKPGLVYIGIPFLLKFLFDRDLANDTFFQSVLHDEASKWPLLSEIAATPDKWLDKGGKGFRQVAT
jgi:hypothetical protein